jgi:ribosomal-protein-alanine N-acetyltransferase
MTDFSIRAASAADGDAVARLESAAFADASWGAKSVIDGLNRLDTKTLVATTPAGDALVGFVMWRLVAEEAEILTIGVANDYRRKSVARALVNRVVSDCEDISIERLFLEVDQGNQAAVRLYKSLGFVRIGIRRRYYKNGADAWVMRLTLR